jgi:D-sedoheptulose 7-phosphate isomerase
LRVPSSNTARIQESHIMIGHILCLLVEKNFF